MADNFWLSDAQWSAIAPLLPMVHSGPRRVDDRGVISGVVHRFRERCRWRALPDDGLQSLQSLEPARSEAGDFHHARRPFAFAGDGRQFRRAGAPLGRRRKKGGAGDWPLARRAHDQNPRAHRRTRPADVFLLTGGQVADIQGEMSNNCPAVIQICTARRIGMGIDKRSLASARPKIARTVSMPSTTSPNAAKPCPSELRLPPSSSSG